MRYGVLAGVLLAGAASAQEGPSFDCARAESSAEELVCSEPGLAQLDREMTRLYGLALNGPHMTPTAEDELKAFQRGWIKGRDECWKADDPRICVRTEYVDRIAELRQGYADARAEDGAGISLGPFVAECPGLGAVVGVVFVNADPGRSGWRGGTGGWCSTKP